MEFTQFVRRPFVVDAIEITEDNIEDIAKLIGKLRVNEATEVPFIALDRRLVPNVPRAYIGWWVTRLGDNYRCYAPKVFNEQFATAIVPAAAEQPQEAEVQKSNVFDAVETDGNVSVLEAGSFDVVQ